MNRLFILALTFAASISTFAADHQLMSIEPPLLAPRTVNELITTLRRPRVSVIQYESSDYSFLIPVAGNSPGNNGTFFRTDVAFTNNRSVAQNIAIGWLAQGVDNTTAPLQYQSLPANSFVSVDDFVGTILKKTGLGAIVVIGVSSDGSIDEDADIDAFSRIWTPQPGSSGTVSQSFPAISLTDSIGSLTANLTGLKQNAQFRTNIGVVNLDSVPHSWTARAAGPGTITNIHVPAYSMLQVSLAPGSSFGSSGNLGLELKSDGSGFWWSAYGSSTDNVTGDGWVSRATQ